MAKLSSDLLAYNGLVDVINEQHDIITAALDTYNRATRAAEEIAGTGGHGAAQQGELVLVEKKKLKRLRERARKPRRSRDIAHAEGARIYGPTFRD